MDLKRNISEMVIVPLIKIQYRLFKKWHKNKFLKSACRNCVSYNDGCCVYPFFWEWKIIVLPKEIERISQFSGKQPSEFIDDSPLVDSQLEYYTEQNGEDPLWGRLFEIWNKPTGLKGSCPFLKPEGCTLPYEVKPMLCQMYPLNFNITENKVFLSEEPDCLLYHVVSGKDEVLEHFKDNSEILQSRFNKFCNELKDLLYSLEHGKT